MTLRIASSFLATCLLSAALPAVLALCLAAPSFAQTSQTAAEIRRDITKLTETRTEQQSAVETKQAEQERNGDQQRRAQAAGNQEELARLKRIGNEIGEEINRVEGKIRDANAQIEEKYRALRGAGREETKLNVGAAVTQAAAGNVAGVAGSIEVARTALTAWADGAKAWPAVNHIESALRQPPLGENRAVAEAELSRLQANLRKAKDEAELEALEISDLDMLLDRGVNHPDWAKLKEELAALRKLLAERKTSLDRLVIRFQNREKAINNFLAKDSD